VATTGCADFGTAHGARQPERTNRRNGYRERGWHTGPAQRVGLGAHQRRHHCFHHRAQQVRIGFLQPLAQPLPARPARLGHRVSPLDHQQPKDDAVAAASPPRLVQHGFGP
jgi:hypothetical protein